MVWHRGSLVEKLDLKVPQIVGLTSLHSPQTAKNLQYCYR